MTVKVPKTAPEWQLLRESPSYFINKVFGYIIAPHHFNILEHFTENQVTLDLAPRGSGKSRVGNIGYASWIICNQPNARLLILSDTDGHSVRFLSTIKNVLSSSPVIEKYYGKIIGSQWSDHQVTTSLRTDKSISEASITALGALSGAVTSGHYTHIICDDLNNFENTRTLGMRTRAKTFFKTTVLPTLLPGGEIRALGCLPKDTNILMANNSWKHIHEIKKGEKVYTFDNGQLTKEYVDDVIFQGSDKILEIQTQRSKIKTNPTHPFLVVSPTSEKKFDSRRYSDIYDFEFEWKKAEDLKKNDAILTINMIEVGNDIHSTDFAWLLGFMTGDGWLTKNERTNGLTSKKYTTWKICFAAGIDNKLNNEVVSLFEKLFSLKMVYKPAERYYLGTSKHVGDFISRAGLKPGAKRKDIPTWIFQGSLKIRRAFIKGLLEADGWGYKNSSKRYSIESSSKKLISDLDLLCRISGLLTSNVYYRKRLLQPPNSPEPVLNESWRIDINFNGAIGMYRLIEKAREKFPFENFRFETVQKVTQVDIEDVWDLTVHKTHNFIAEGFITHNTRYHYDDLYKTFMNELGYDTLIQPAIIDPGTPKERSIWEAFMPLHSRMIDGVMVKGLIEIRDGVPGGSDSGIGSLIFNLQYMNDTSLQESGKIFKYDWFNFYDKLPHGLKVYQGVDLAISKKDTADFFVVLTVGIDKLGNVYILDIYRKRGVTFNDQVRTVIKKAEEWKPLRIGIEINAYQAVLAEEVKRLTLLPIMELPTSKDKVMRAQMRSGLVESRRVHVKSNMHDFISELTMFDADAEHDDQFDAFDFALTVAEAGTVEVVPSNYYVPEFDTLGIYD